MKTLRALFTFWVALILILLLAPRSIWGTIEGVFSGIFGDVEDVVNAVISVAETIWSLLVDTANILSTAWQAVETGVQYFVGVIENFAEGALNAVSHIVTEVIPQAVLGVINEIDHGIGSLWSLVQDFVAVVRRDVEGVATGLFDDVRNFAEGLFNEAKELILVPLHWVEKEGAKILNFIEHPELIAEAIAGVIVLPVLKWLLQSSTPVLKWLWQRATQAEGEVATMLEDFIEEVL